MLRKKTCNAAQVLTDDEGTGRKTESTGLTTRSIVLSLVFLIILIALTQYAGFTNAIGGLDPTMMPSVAGMTFVLLLMLVSSLSKRFKIDPSELLLIYIVLMLGGLLTSVGLVQISIGNMASLVLLNMDNPGLYGSIFDQMSSHVVIKDQVAGIGFWLGSSDGVPWRLWISPIIVWTIFWGAMFWVLLCMATIVRSHWTDREQLVYPLVSPVVELTKSLQPESTGSLWNDVIFRWGLIIPVLFFLPRTVRFYVPGMPIIPDVINLGEFFKGEPWSAVNNWPGFKFMVNPLVIGIGYLVSSELTFSLWFFYLIFKVPLQVGFSSAGRFELFQMSLELGRGMFIGIALYSLYLVRSDLKMMFGKAFMTKSSSKYDDSNEPLPYALAFWGGLAALVFIVLFSTLVLKISLLGALVYLAIFFGVSFGFARLRAEAGYPHTQPAMQFTNVYMLRGLGQDRLGTTTSFALTNYFNPMDEGYFGSVTGVLLECYKFGDYASIKRRSLTKILVITFLVATVFGYVFALPVIYKHGMFNLDQFRMYHSKHSYAGVTLQYWPAEWFGAYAIGIFTGLAMMFLRTSFVWWPIHPLGAAIAPQSWMGNFWASFFVAWVVKTVVMRYGGPKVVEKVRPFFVSLIVGTVAMSVMDAVIRIIVGLLFS